MTVTFTNTNYAVSVAPFDLISSAMIECGALGPGEVPNASDAAWGLEKLQRLLDQFNAEQPLIYNVGFGLFNLIANHSPHTIGPTGDFQVPIRPVKILSASFVLNGGSTNPVDTPITLRDDDWWAANPLKSLASSIITDLYYSPDIPNGNLFFYPISNVIAPVRLEYWTGLAQALNLQTKISFPAGYWDAITLQLAVRIFPSLFDGRDAPPTLIAIAQKALQSITPNNNDAPRIQTNTGGMPGAGPPGRPDFNFLTGMRD